MKKKPRRRPSAASSSAQQVYRYLPVIQILGKLNKSGDPLSRRLQGKVLELSPETVRAVGNITLNALNDRLPMTARQKKELQKRHVQAQKLAATSGSVAGKRKIIQEGGFLPLIAGLVPAAVSLLSSIVGGGRD